MYPRKIGTGDNVYFAHMCYYICQEMFYLNTIEQLILFVEQLDQIEICLPYHRLLTGIPIFQNLRWNSNKTSLSTIFYLGGRHQNIHIFCNLA